MNEQSNKVQESESSTVPVLIGVDGLGIHIHKCKMFMSL